MCANMLTKVIVLAVLVNVLGTLTASTPANDKLLANFIATDDLLDGEAERRIHLHGLYAKEIIVFDGFGNETTGGLKLRQVTDGKRALIQLIYGSDGLLKDCEIFHQKQAAINFAKNFANEAERARTGVSDMKNITFRVLGDNEPMPEDIASWLDWDGLRHACKARHKELQRLVHARDHGTQEERREAHEHIDRLKRDVSSFLISPGTKWCGPKDIAKRYVDLGFFTSMDKCCRKHDHCPISIPSLTSNFNLFNYRPFTLNHCKCDMRHKRELMDVFRVPGTRWCGKGNTAFKYTHLGGFGSADKCCRHHDTGCSLFISSLEEKYGLFNWRISTIMHCKCDNRFRTCLKLSNTGAANLVGKLFFNIVQSKCFVLKPKRVCIKRSWWGKCERHAYRKTAILRDNKPY